MVSDVKEGLVIDHINNDKLDNRLINLQQITTRLNTSKDRPAKKSKYTGVFWKEDNGKWQVSISAKCNQIYLGLYADEKEANKVYEKAVKEYNLGLPIIRNTIRTKKTSKFKGVSLRKNKWIAQISINKKRIYLGSFNTEIEAHEAYQNKLKEINKKL